MAIVKVQQVTGNGTTLVLNSVAAGNTLFLCDSYYRLTGTQAAEAVPTDTNGTFSASNASVPAVFLGTSDIGCGIFHQQNTASGTHTVTPQANTLHKTSLSEFSGLATSGLLDVTASAKTASATITSQVTGTTATTTQADELVLICLGFGDPVGVADVGFTNPVSGFTSIFVASDTSTSVATFHAFKTVAATGTQTATFNWTASETGMSAQAAVATFKAASTTNTCKPYNYNTKQLRNSDFRKNPFRYFVSPPGQAAGGPVTHATTGVLAGQTGTIVGVARHQAKHVSTGVLAGQTGVIAGVAKRFRTHATSGVLAGQTGTLSGIANRFRVHATSGILAGQTGVIAGVARRFRAHATSGILAGQTGTVVGVAAHVSVGSGHNATGILAGQTGTIVGTASNITTHLSTGVLAGQTGVIAGVARRFRAHATSGILLGQTGTIVGVARHQAKHVSTGVLAGQTGVIAGVARHNIKHPTTGVLAGQRGAVVGFAFNGVSTTTAEFVPNGVPPDPYSGSPNYNPTSEPQSYRSPNGPLGAPGTGFGSPNGVGGEYSSPNMPRV